MLTLEHAIVFATQAHAGQKDLVGIAYIVHPLSVMMKMDTDTERIVAVLHDVTEDTAFTLEDIKELGITEEMCIALKLLDKNAHSPADDKELRYKNMVVAIAANPLARKIKVADLEHNMDLFRIIGRKQMKQKDMERINKYMWAWSYLTGK
jgi:(p)ppGpp synthase/HD superfamily hydrolase